MAQQEGAKVCVYWLNPSHCRHHLILADPREASLACLTGCLGHLRLSIKEGTNLMDLLGQIIWELMEYFGEMIWQTTATIPLVAVLLVVGVVIELLFGKSIRDRRPTDWKPTDAQNWDY